MIDPELIPIVARRFKALGEPGRLTLLAVLQEGERSVSELVERSGRSQPNVSQHLKEMAHAGLVEARREGARVFYRISDPYVSRICDAVCRSVRDAQGPAFARPSAAARRHTPRRERSTGGRVSAGARG